MERRRFLELAALPAIASTTTALAGCTGAGGAGSGTTTDDTTTTEDTTMTDDTTTTEDTTTMLPCPAVRDVDRHVCPGDTDGPIAVTRSGRSMPADAGTIAVTVENTSSGRVGLNPYAWAVHRQADGDWDRVDVDRVYIEPWHELAPGESVDWHVASDADAESSSDAIACALDLDAGTYAWSVSLLPDDTDERVAAVAPFVVE